MAARMRTIKEAITEIKQEDPHSALTESYLRKLVRSGDFPSVKVGVKTLINLDRLMEYLGSQDEQEPPQESDDSVKVNPDGTRELCLRIVV